MKNEIKTYQENYQFRILYFIGIFLVVANHIPGGGTISLLYDWFPPYSFHLALFVFASGYFFINNKDTKIIRFIIKIIKKFLIPLYFWNLMYGIIVFFLHKFGITFGNELNFKSLIILPMYSGHQYLFNLASWFIWPLFIIQFLNIFVIKLLNKNDKLYYLYFIFTLFIGFLGVQLAINGYNKDFMLLLVKIMYFLPFFAFGMLYKTKLEKKDTLNNFLYLLIIFILSFVVMFFLNGRRWYDIAWCNNFDNFYKPFIVGLLGIAFWLRISKILVPSLKDSKIVKIISKNTFDIMIHHLMGFFILNSFILLCSKLFNFIEGFNYNLYKSQIYYFYYPKQLGQFGLFYIIFGFLFSLLISFAKNIVKDKINNLYLHFKYKTKSLNF